MRHHTFALAAALVLSTGPALAQGVDEFGAYGGDESSNKSDQMWAIELRFGPYLPDVDSEFANATPFKDTFGTTHRILVGFEADWQALRIPYVGSLGPGAAWGYTRMSADALLADGSGRSEQETSLSVMPMYLVGVLRVDVLSRETVIPLSVYGKAGVGYALWWAGGGSSEADGVSDDGASYGLHVGAGAMLKLNFLEPSTANAMDAQTGINNSHLFFEYYSSNLDGFGSGDQMQVGDTTWAVGLVVEM